MIFIIILLCYDRFINICSYVTFNFFTFLTYIQNIYTNCIRHLYRWYKTYTKHLIINPLILFQSLKLLEFHTKLLKKHCLHTCTYITFCLLIFPCYIQVIRPMCTMHLYKVPYCEYLLIISFLVFD